MLILRMLKKLLFLFFLLVSFVVLAQDATRVLVRGTILVPEGGELFGVTIFNESSKQGTSTNEEGNFELLMRTNDSLIVSALQYRSFDVSVEPNTIASGAMIIDVTLHINELEEVLIIKKNFVEGWDLSYENLEYGYDFSRDEKESIDRNYGDEAINSRKLINGLNFVSIFREIFPKKEKKTDKQIVYGAFELVAFIKAKYSVQDIATAFHIPIESANDFIYYVAEGGIDTALLLDENEILLLEFLQEQSKKYTLKE